MLGQRKYSQSIEEWFAVRLGGAPLIKVQDSTVHTKG